MLWRVQLKGDESQLKLQRFTPLLQDIIEAQVAGTLSESEYVWVNPPSTSGMGSGFRVQGSGFRV